MRRSYEEMRRSWLRRNRPLFFALGAITGAVIVVTFLAGRAFPAAGWLLGFLAGAVTTTLSLLRASPPGWIENWQVGALGERATARRLRLLEPQGWVILHDLQAGQGNIDHIAVGPGGVFLLDSKRPGGEVRVEGGKVTVHRLDAPHLYYNHPGTAQLLHLARRTHDRMLARSRINMWVSPVMVIWADFPQRIVDERCAYVHGDELVAWLQTRPRRIAPERVEQIADAVRQAWSLDGERPAARSVRLASSLDEAVGCA
jgi:hypothetical protein